MPCQPKVEMKARVNQVSWLTPSEIFTPHYGKAIASHILEVHRKEGQKALQIFELGAGTGTLALDILDHLRAVISSLAPIPNPTPNPSRPWWNVDSGIFRQSWQLAGFYRASFLGLLLLQQPLAQDYIQVAGYIRLTKFQGWETLCRDGLSLLSADGAWDLQDLHLHQLWDQPNLRWTTISETGQVAWTWKTI